MKIKALVVAGHDQKLSIDDSNAKSKVELLCGGQMVTEIAVYILTGSGFHGSYRSRKLLFFLMPQQFTCGQDKTKKINTNTAREESWKPLSCISLEQWEKIIGRRGRSRLLFSHCFES